MPQMNKMSYLCRAERQVRVKANASSPDCHLNLNAPSRGSQVCRTSKPGICKSSFSERMCQVKQHGFFACVYRISTATKRVSTDSVNEEKKCLVKSGKVSTPAALLFSGRQKIFWRPLKITLVPYNSLSTPFWLPVCRHLSPTQHRTDKKEFGG